LGWGGRAWVGQSGYAASAVLRAAAALLRCAGSARNDGKRRRRRASRMTHVILWPQRHRLLPPGRPTLLATSIGCPPGQLDRSRRACSPKPLPIKLPQPPAATGHVQGQTRRGRRWKSEAWENTERQRTARSPTKTEKSRKHTLTCCASWPSEASPLPCPGRAGAGAHGRPPCWAVDCLDARRCWPSVAWPAWSCQTTSRTSPWAPADRPWEPSSCSAAVWTTSLSPSPLALSCGGYVA